MDVSITQNLITFARTVKLNLATSRNTDRQGVATEPVEPGKRSSKPLMAAVNRKTAVTRFGDLCG